MGVLARALNRRARVTAPVHVSDPTVASMFVDPSETFGMDVTPESAQTLSTVFACVTAIAEDCAKLPVEVLRHAGRERTVLENDPLWVLLNHRPNPYMSAFVFRELLAAWAQLWHGGFAEIQRDAAGEPVALWPIPPWRVTVNVGTNDVLYEVRGGGGGTRVLGSFNVLHVRGRTYDGVRAMGVIAYARSSLAIGLAADRMAGKMMNNSFTQRGVLKWTAKPDPKAREKAVKDMETGFVGPNATGTILDIPFGAELTPYAMTAEDAEFISQRKFQAEEVCRWFRMPPHKVGILDRATFSNIEHQAIQYKGDTLQPWLVRQETEWNIKLVGDPSKRLEHNESELLRGDAKARMEYYGAGRQWGIFSSNDCRRMENMEPIEGGDDDYLRPVNMVVIGEDPDPASPAPQTPPAPNADPDASQEPEEAARAAFRLSVEALGFGLRASLRSCAKVAGSNASKAVKAGEAAGWSRKFAGQHADHVVGAVMPFAEACRSLALATLRTGPASITVADLAANLSSVVLARIGNTRVDLMKPEEALSVFENSVEADATEIVAMAVRIFTAKPKE